MHHCRTENAEADLLDAGDGYVEHRPWLAHGREARKRDGIAGEQQPVAARRAIEQGYGEAAPDPERQGEAEQQRLVVQVRH